MADPALKIGQVQNAFLDRCFSKFTAENEKFKARMQEPQAAMQGMHQEPHWICALAAPSPAPGSFLAAAFGWLLTQAQHLKLPQQLFAFCLH